MANEANADPDPSAMGDGEPAANTTTAARKVTISTETAEIQPESKPTPSSEQAGGSENEDEFEEGSVFNYEGEEEELGEYFEPERMEEEDEGEEHEEKEESDEDYYIPKEIQKKRNTELNFQNVEDLSNMLTKIKLVWPENLVGYDPDQFATDPSRKGYPKSYYTCSGKEKAVLWHAENFRRQFLFKYPKRRPLYIAPKNQCGVQKLFPTFIYPVTLRYRVLYDFETCVKFFTDFFAPTFIEPVNDLPKCIQSHDALIKSRKANAFEISIIIVSLMIGAGWDAYVVDGYATEEITTLCATGDFVDEFEGKLDYFEGDEGEENEKDEEPTKVVSTGDEEEYRGKEEPIRPVSPSKYKVSPKKKFQSKYQEMMDVREEVRRKEELELAEKLAQEEMERNKVPPIPDPMFGFRTHAWVLIKPREGDPFEEPFFLEPFTGTKREILDPGFTGIEAVFNHKNYWANLQECTGCGYYSYDFSDNSNWAQLLYIPDFRKEKAKAKQKEGEAVKIDDDEDEEEQEDRNRNVEIYLDMPVSWTRDFDISEEEFALRYPGGTKTFQYNDAIVDVSSPYVNKDGLIRKVLKFHGKSRKAKDLIHIEERFSDRVDCLTMRKWTRKGRMVHEHFEKGRKDALKDHFHVAGKNKPNYPRHLYYYSNAHLENVYHREILPKGLVEDFKNRDDFLYYRFTAFGDVLCETVPEKEVDSKNRAMMDFVRGDTQKKRAKRKIVGIVEKFHRNPAKEPSDDIAEKYMLIDEARFRVAFHYGDEAYTRMTIEFFKPTKGSQKAAVDFKPEDSIEFRVDPYTPPLSNYQKFLYLKRLKKDQVRSSEEARAAEEEIHQTVSDRVQEDWKHQLIAPARYEVEKTAEEEKEEMLQLDFASPYLEIGVPRNKEEELALKRRIMEDAKDRILKKIETIKESYARESGKLQQLLKQSPQAEDDLAEEEKGVASPFEQTLIKMQAMEQLLVRIRAKAPGDYCSLMIQVVQHPLLNRFAIEEKEEMKRQAKLKKEMELLAEAAAKAAVAKKSCCTLNYFFKYKEKKFTPPPPPRESVGSLK